jgi:hypothetical protein
MLTKPVLLLRTEGVFILSISVLCYREMHFSWLLFAVLLLVPDLSMAGYLAGVKIGAAVYNVVHTLTGPLILIGYSILSAHLSLLLYGLIWTAHIGMDRVCGFGLKYPTRFNDTHLQRV